MRWFRKLEDSGPRLISLSPLRSDAEANGSNHREDTSSINEYPVRPSSAPLAPCSLRRKHAVRRRPAAKSTRWRSSEAAYVDRNCETPDLSEFWGRTSMDDFALAEPIPPPEVYFAALKNLEYPEESDWSRSGHTISYHQGRRLSPIRAYGGAATPRRTSSMDNLAISTKNELVSSLQPSKERCSNPVTESSKSKTKWKTLSDKYLKTTTPKSTKTNFANGLLNKLKGTKQAKPGPEATAVSNYRSFSCGTLPGIQEFRQRLRRNDSADDRGSIIAEEKDPGEMDNDSGIVQEWSDSSISSENSYIGQVLPCQTLSSWRKPQPKMRSSLSPLLQPKSQQDCLPKCRSKKPMETVQETSELQLTSSKPSEPCEEAKEPVLCHKTRIHVSYPAPKYCSNSLDRKQFSKSRKLKLPAADSSVQFIRIQRDSSSPEGSELGILIARKKFSDADTAGYVVAHIVPDGLVHRDGRIKVGDEIINVNGRRLRNMSVSEASSVLHLPVSSIDLVISRRNSAEVSRSGTAGATVITVNSSPSAGNHDYENVVIPVEHPHSADDSGIEASEDGSLSSEVNESAELESKPSNYCTLPRKQKAPDSQSFFTVVYEKGPGKKSLGFTIVGGTDSPKGVLGFYVKTILNGGQAAQDQRLQPGDELIAVNGLPLEGKRHAEAIAVFKAIKTGPVALQVSRRPKKTNRRIVKSRSCENLLQEINDKGGS